MQSRIASIKETGEEVSPIEWERFDAAVAEVKAERKRRLAEDVALEPEPVERDRQAVV